MSSSSKILYNARKIPLKTCKNISFKVKRKLHRYNGTFFRMMVNSWHALTLYLLKATWLNVFVNYIPFTDLSSPLHWYKIKRNWHMLFLINVNKVNPLHSLKHPNFNTSFSHRVKLKESEPPLDHVISEAVAVNFAVCRRLSEIYKSILKEYINW